MKFRRTTASEPNPRDSAMTPMIDVVFQLLAFFVLTFKVVVPEGDFGITMPSALPTPSEIPPLVEPLNVQLIADPNGKLADVRVNGTSLGPNIDALHRHTARIAGIEGPSSLRTDIEVKLDCDPQLRYEYTMAALTAVSAYFDVEGNPATLIERVQFARRRA
jgi:biopolymer transport protein ExbD